MRVDQVETSLRELLGARLAPLSERRVGRSEYRFADGSGGQVDLVLDGLRSGVTVHGRGRLAEQFVRLIRYLDSPAEPQGQSSLLVPLRRADPAKVRQAVEAYRGSLRQDGLLEPESGGEEDRGATRPARPKPRANQQGARFPHAGIELVSYLFEGEGAPPAARPGRMADQTGGKTPPAKVGEGSDSVRQLRREPTDDVEIETLPDVGVIILRGRRRDVEEVRKIIEEIERLSAETQPTIEIY
jgi:type II secretory pathway component GspD/PulD (secretin)